MILRLSVISLLFGLFCSFGAQAERMVKAKEIDLMKPYDIGRYIKESVGKRRAIALYASWCSVCVQKMPQIIEIERADKGSIIAVSVDEDHKMFRRYINRLEDVPFRIILNDAPEWKLARNFKQFDVEPWDSLPQIILLDKDNDLVGQGNYSIEEITEFLSVID